MNLEQSLMNHDQPLIKWWNILQNENVDKKSWSLTVFGSQLIFALAQSIFGPFEQLTEQTSSARLETWHEWSWEHIRTFGENLRSFGCKDLDATQNPNLRLTVLGDDLTVQLLSNLEPFGDYSCNVLRNMRGIILGCNTVICLEHPLSKYNLI